MRTKRIKKASNINSAFSRSEITLTDFLKISLISLKLITSRIKVRTKVINRSFCPIGIKIESIPVIRESNRKPMKKYSSGLKLSSVPFSPGIMLIILTIEIPRTEKTIKINIQNKITRSIT
jgi:hypothetical protein